MASNNLRIIYQNILDLSGTTITASSTASAATPTTNLKLDSKSQVWRSASQTSTSYTSPSGDTLYRPVANLVITLTSAQIVGGVIFPFCNLSQTAKIRVRGYTGTAALVGTPAVQNTTDPGGGVAGGTLIFDSTVTTAAPYQNFGLWNWGSIPLGVNSYSYGGGTYGRVWIPTPQACTSILIEIYDPACVSPYIEISRIVAGSYWSPKYNTSFGLSTGSQDLSQHERSESGDLITNRGIRYRNMKFELTWLPPEDRLEFTRILRGNGLPRPLFISLFPNNSEDYEKEQAHQIYGKLSTLNDITHPIFEMYSTSIEIEEI